MFRPGTSGTEKAAQGEASYNNRLRDFSQIISNLAALKML